VLTQRGTALLFCWRQLFENADQDGDHRKQGDAGHKKVAEVPDRGGELVHIDLFGRAAAFDGLYVSELLINITFMVEGRSGFARGLRFVNCGLSLRTGGTGSVGVHGGQLLFCLKLHLISIIVTYGGWKSIFSRIVKKDWICGEATWIQSFYKFEHNCEKWRPNGPDLLPV